MITYKHLGKMGKLGNCLFQIATTESHAIKMNTTSGYPLWIYQKYFEYKLHVANEFPTRDYYEPDDFSYRPIPMVDDINLCGYFQSYKYFEDNKSHILKIFRVNNEIEERISRGFKFIEDTETCSIHVRRGDYLNMPEYHPFLGIEYYKNAIDLFDNNMLFVVFSDDINWCKENFGKINRRFVYIDYNNQPIELHIMKLCKNHIIANSSFSWWGAYLCENHNQTVIAPKKWFGVAYNKYTTKDLLPPLWRQIDV